MVERRKDMVEGRKVNELSMRFRPAVFVRGGRRRMRKRGEDGEELKREGRKRGGSLFG
jgi:hypothetical protein